MTDELMHARAALARAGKYRRDGTRDEAALSAARAHYTGVKLERSIREAITGPNAITAEQRRTLAEMLTGGAK